MCKCTRYQKAAANPPLKRKKQEESGGRSAPLPPSRARARGRNTHLPFKWAIKAPFTGMWRPNYRKTTRNKAKNNSNNGRGRGGAKNLVNSSNRASKSECRTRAIRETHRGKRTPSRTSSACRGSISHRSRRQQTLDFRNGKTPIEHHHHPPSSATTAKQAPPARTVQRTKNIDRTM